MRISTYSDYSLRVLMQAAARAPDRLTIDDVATGYRISRNHLVKVVHGLSKGGFLSTQRGRSGGFTLARPADKIRVGDVVRFTESETVLVECFDPANNTCVITPACKLKFILHQALESFYAELNRHTVADLYARPEQLLRHLATA